MHDIKWIRANPEAFDVQLARRGLSPLSSELIALDEAKRTAQTQLQELQSERNQLAKSIGQAKAKKENADALMEQSRNVNERLAELEATLKDDGLLEQKLAAIPNGLADEVPEGKDEAANREIRQYGTKREYDFVPKEHFDLGEALGLMDFERAAHLSGARFVVLKGALARMERALAAYMLDTHTQEFGYTEMVTPYLVKDAAVFGTAQLPKFADDLFQTTNGFWLIPTAEVPLTNLVGDQVLDEKNLPMRMTAYTPCFRSEAGSAGKDTRGMIRQHQFSKVELVSIVHPDEAEREHDRMTGCAEALLQRLGLHYRVMLLCAGDTGFASRKTYDIEVWLPGQNAYREISSCSQFGEFHARRMKARFRSASEKGTQHVHTLNGSGLPIGRTIVAILENYQQADGAILIPEVLRPYMGGLDKISAA